MLTKFCSVLHQANTLDDITGQQQVTSNMVTNPSGCICKVTEKSCFSCCRAAWQAEFSCKPEVAEI